MTGLSNLCIPGLQPFGSQPGKSCRSLGLIGAPFFHENYVVGQPFNMSGYQMRAPISGFFFAMHNVRLKKESGAVFLSQSPPRPMKSTKMEVCPICKTRC